MTKELFEVTGFYYTDSAVQLMIDRGWATADEDNQIEVNSWPEIWDRYFTSGHWNPDVAQFYSLRHWAESKQAVCEELKTFTWVEPPTIVELDEDEANHQMMLDRGEAMLPGFECDQ